VEAQLARIQIVFSGNAQSNNQNEKQRLGKGTPQKKSLGQRKKSTKI